MSFTTAGQASASTQMFIAQEDTTLNLDAGSALVLPW
jgi:hypothetical protein